MVILTNEMQFHSRCALLSGMLRFALCSRAGDEAAEQAGCCVKGAATRRQPTHCNL